MFFTGLRSLTGMYLTSETTDLCQSLLATWLSVALDARLSGTKHTRPWLPPSDNKWNHMFLNSRDSLKKCWSEFDLKDTFTRRHWTLGFVCQRSDFKFLGLLDGVLRREKIRFCAGFLQTKHWEMLALQRGRNKPPEEPVKCFIANMSTRIWKGSRWELKSFAIYR